MQICFSHWLEIKVIDKNQSQKTVSTKILLSFSGLYEFEANKNVQIPVNFSALGTGL